MRSVLGYSCLWQGRSVCVGSSCGAMLVVASFDSSVCCLEACAAPTCTYPPNTTHTLFSYRCVRMLSSRSTSLPGARRRRMLWCGTHWSSFGRSEWTWGGVCKRDCVYVLSPRGRGIVGWLGVYVSDCSAQRHPSGAGPCAFPLFLLLSVCLSLCALPSHNSCSSLLILIQVHVLCELHRTHGRVV